MSVPCSSALTDDEQERVLAELDEALDGLGPGAGRP
jgi:hypothetical protein